jgi:hypothetical protein
MICPYRQIWDLRAHLPASFFRVKMGLLPDLKVVSMDVAIDRIIIGWEEMCP